MTVPARAVTVTGYGAVSPAGWSAEETWASVAAGTSSIRTLERFELPGVSVSAIGCAPGLERYDGTDSLALRFADAAASDALAMAGLDGAGGAAVDYAVVANHGERSLDGDRVAVVASAQEIADHVGARAGAPTSLALYGACAGGGLAVGTGLRLIQQGLADCVVAGGVDCLVHDFDFMQFGLLCAMSLRDCPPEEACCPFDRRRDGFVLSEGAGFVVLEAADRARQRGVPTHGAVLGFASRQNAYDIVASPPDAAGPAAAMAGAIADAGLTPGDIDYINAHGTSTNDNDWCETLAIRKVFGGGADAVPASASKSGLGHTMAAAGAIEVIISLLALRDGLIPPTINLLEPDPHCDLDYVPGSSRKADLRHVLSNSFGFGGHSSALVLGAGHAD